MHSIEQPVGPNLAPDSVSPPEAPVKVLLWAPNGSGEHYNGPASFTYRMFSQANDPSVQISLAHGSAQQEAYGLFKGQHYIGAFKGSPAHYLNFIARGKRWLAQNHSSFEVFHGTCGYQYTVSPAYTAQKLGLPAIIFISNHLSQLGDRGGWRQILGLAARRREMVRNVSAMVAMSQDIFDELTSYGIAEDRIARIPMGINRRIFHPLASALHPDAGSQASAGKEVVAQETNPDNARAVLRKTLGIQDMPTLLFSGSVVHRKRPDLLVEAIGLLKAQQLECQLLIAGPTPDPQYHQQILQRCGELGVSDRVHWLGFTSNIAQYYQAADFFGLPSSNEGMSASLIEAMSCGATPIATPVSGSVDVIKPNETGTLIPPDAKAISHALRDYLKDMTELRRQSANASELVLQKYTTDVVYAAYKRLYQRVRAGHTPAG